MFFSNLIASRIGNDKVCWGYAVEGGRQPLESAWPRGSSEKLVAKAPSFWQVEALKHSRKEVGEEQEKDTDDEDVSNRDIQFSPFPIRIPNSDRGTGVCQGQNDLALIFRTRR